MRNSSLVECGCADNGTGLKFATEAAGGEGGGPFFLVGERGQGGEASGGPLVER